MSFKDILSERLINGFGNSDLSIAEILLTLFITFIIALYLFAVYRTITENAFYSRNYNIAMVAMAVVTAGIILAMQSSLVISLGMVGALSIVRFRTAIKEPMDLLFLFWSIGTGIICGAGLYKVAIILAICVTLTIVILRFVPENNAGQILFIGSKAPISDEEIKAIVAPYGKIIATKSKNMTASGTNVVYSVKLKDEDGLIAAINAHNGIESVSIVAHDGEFRG